MRKCTTAKNSKIVFRIFLAVLFFFGILYRFVRFGTSSILLGEPDKFPSRLPQLNKKGLVPQTVKVRSQGVAQWKHWKGSDESDINPFTWIRNISFNLLLSWEVVYPMVHTLLARICGPHPVACHFPSLCRLTFSEFAKNQRKSTCKYYVNFVI